MQTKKMEVIDFKDIVTQPVNTEVHVKIPSPFKDIEDSFFKMNKWSHPKNPNHINYDMDFSETCIFVLTSEYNGAEFAITDTPGFLASLNSLGIYRYEIDLPRLYFQSNIRNVFTIRKPGAPRVTGVQICKSLKIRTDSANKPYFIIDSVPFEKEKLQYKKLLKITSPFEIGFEMGIMPTERVRNYLFYYDSKVVPFFAGEFTEVSDIKDFSNFMESGSNAIKFIEIISEISHLCGRYSLGLTTAHSKNPYEFSDEHSKELIRLTKHIVSKYNFTEHTMISTRELETAIILAEDIVAWAFDHKDIGKLEELFLDKDFYDLIGLQLADLIELIYIFCNSKPLSVKAALSDTSYTRNYFAVIADKLQVVSLKLKRLV